MFCILLSQHWKEDAMGAGSFLSSWTSWAIKDSCSRSALCLCWILRSPFSSPKGCSKAVLPVGLLRRESLTQRLCVLRCLLALSLEISIDVIPPFCRHPSHTEICDLDSGVMDPYAFLRVPISLSFLLCPIPSSGHAFTLRPSDSLLSNVYFFCFLFHNAPRALEGVIYSWFFLESWTTMPCNSHLLLVVNLLHVSLSATMTHCKWYLPAQPRQAKAVLCGHQNTFQKEFVSRSCSLN